MNAKVYGLATESAGCKSIISGLLDAGIGIIQLPCVEQSCFGINRWGQVKNQMDFPGFRSLCKSLLQPIVEQVSDFYHNGYQISAIIGIDGSPACGVKYTCAGDWGGEFTGPDDVAVRLETLKTENAYGVMMEVLQGLLLAEKINVPFLSVDESNPESSSKELINALSD